MKYININNIITNILTLYVFYKVIDKFPDLQKYNKNSRFNFYRSLMCLSFTILSFISVIKYFKMGYSFPFEYHTDEFNELHELFISYILFDLIKMIFEKCKRKDLYIHHIFIMTALLIYKLNGYAGFLITVILFNEIISIVSGMDSLAMEDNDMVLSMNFKKIRKCIIKFIRLPIWILLFLFNTKYIGRVPKLLTIVGYLTFVIMMSLDFYWESKCDKVINKYKSKSK